MFAAYVNYRKQNCLSNVFTYKILKFLGTHKILREHQQKTCIIPKKMVNITNILSTQPTRFF